MKMLDELFRDVLHVAVQQAQQSRAGDEDQRALDELDRSDRAQRDETPATGARSGGTH